MDSIMDTLESRVQANGQSVDQHAARPGQADSIFSDGFESGSLSPIPPTWSSLANSQNLNVSPAAAYWCKGPSYLVE